MRCPRCKQNDVYLSSSGNPGIFWFLTKGARCHRCCHLLRVFFWVDVPEKPAFDPLDSRTEMSRQLAKQVNS